MDLINAFILTAASSGWVLLVMFAVAAIDAVFPPIPSETVLVAAAAAAAASGALATVPLLCVAAALGAVLGDNLAYALGRSLGTERFAWMRRPRVAAAFGRARTSLSRGGAALIIGARYVPVGRVAVAASAGALGYPWRRFVSLTAVAAALWALYGAGIGILAGNWLGDQPLLAAAIGVGVALVIGVGIDRVAAARRRRRAADAPSAAAETTEMAEVAG
ncbi:DedA family protein [Microbacterium protaetiae]|uniref:DedA family protein n=1 Tax=Microbacterium protaetiae TaxID=2509458 RepID=A0A4P6EGF1_9MICO|nr:DedA family protein [Microbacterium protaetiae]QAY61520.1 DedA family protein [Microbacterium protaetiae]